ncbi:MAG: hypothetical protein AAGC70_04295 [Pseudomonadota bacterium]
MSKDQNKPDRKTLLSPAAEHDGESDDQVQVPSPEPDAAEASAATERHLDNVTQAAPPPEALGATVVVNPNDAPNTAEADAPDGTDAQSSNATEAGAPESSAPETDGDLGPTVVVNRSARREEPPSGATRHPPTADVASSEAHNGDVDRQRLNTALKPGTAVGADYRVVQVLGAEPLGIRYLAEDVHLNRQVVLREVLPAGDFARAADGNVAAGPDRDLDERISTFEDGARALRQHRIAHVQRILDAVEAFGTRYFVFAWEGLPTLRVWLDNLGRPPTQMELDKIVGPLVKALVDLDRVDLLKFHANIAPDTILVRADGSPVFAGFGLARTADKAPVGAAQAARALSSVILIAMQSARDAAAANTGGSAASPALRPIDYPEDYRVEFVGAVADALSPGSEREFPGLDTWGARLRAPAAGASHDDVTRVRSNARPAAVETDIPTRLIATLQTARQPLAAGLSQVGTVLQDAADGISAGSATQPQRVLFWSGLAVAGIGTLLLVVSNAFGLAAVLQVAGLGLLLLAGALPIRAFLSSATTAESDIRAAVDAASRHAALTVFLTYAIIAVNPIVTAARVPDGDQNIWALSLIFLFAGAIVGVFGVTGAALGPSWQARLFSIAYAVVFAFSCLLSIVWIVTIFNLEAAQFDIQKVNRFTVFVATASATVLLGMTYLARFGARQRLRHTGAGA